MQQSLADRKHDLDIQVKGFLRPVFQREDPTTGRTLNGLAPADFDKVTAGYACPECLAEFNTYTHQCPVCRYTRNLLEDVESAPAYWQQHLEDRASGYNPPVPDSIETMLDRVANDPDVEHVPLSKLKPRRNTNRLV